MPIPCNTFARPDSLRRSSRHGTVPKTRSMNMKFTIYTIEPTRPAQSCPKTIQITRDMLSDTPAVKRGSPNLAVRDRHDIQAPFQDLSAMPSSMSSLHDNKRTGQWRPKGTHHCNLCLSSTDVSLDTNLVVPIKDRQHHQQVWWSQTGSNRRPQACKASALPTELWPQFRHLNTNQRLVGLSGLEPLTSRLSGVCSNHLSYRPLSVLRPSRPRDRGPVTQKVSRSDLPNTSVEERETKPALGPKDLRIP